MPAGDVENGNESDRRSFRLGKATGWRDSQVISSKVLPPIIRQRLLNVQTGKS